MIFQLAVNMILLLICILTQITQLVGLSLCGWRGINSSSNDKDLLYVLF